MLLRGFMTLLRIGAIEFGMLLLLLFGMAIGQTARRGWRRRWRGEAALRVEELLLGAAAVVTGGWYLRLEVRGGGRAMAGMTGISWGWVVGYGAVCAVYLVAKAWRAQKAGRVQGSD
jgi:hypothetical protein